MKKALFGLLTIMLVIIAAYFFYNHVLHNTYKGTVIKIEENAMLFATESSLEIEKELSEKELQQYMDNSIWFNTSEEKIEKIQIGDIVTVRAGNAVDESLPPRMDAEQIKK
ncbi:DUF3221 domain-containing protein [Alkalicoccus daliensis]|uniref:DUF3221 domain-containing protein n=1 Tax=Alkalicoccus daliensis TaxID=745820 RepID=A0A1H0CYU4_9BACI|nr:DUF3221 domain-containing protein [Alkalicoccus daliensis]SDN63072.1 Protein of unknown function [Alkalicoccus daliensis]